MINTKQMRMVKESLLYLYRRDFRFIDIPVYFCDNNEVSQEDITEGVKALNELDEIPWPSHNCILMGVCPWRDGDFITREYGVEYLFYVMLKIDFKPKGFKEVNIRPVLNEGVVIDYSYQYYMLSVALFRNRVQIRETPYYLARGHSPLWSKSYVLEHCRAYARVEAQTAAINLHNYKSELIVDSDGRFRGINIKESLSDEQMKEISRAERGLRTFYEKTLPEVVNENQRFWLGSTQEEELLTFPLATQLLSCLTTMVIPCHYLVKSDWGEGFGEKRFKRKIAGKPFFSLVNYNRLYREAVKGDSDIQRQPHFRRGHVRYLWKEAGINRHILPPVASVRMRLAKEHKVRRVYVTPSWIGPKVFTSGGYNYEILTGEIEW